MEHPHRGFFLFVNLPNKRSNKRSSSSQKARKHMALLCICHELAIKRYPQGVAVCGSLALHEPMAHSSFQTGDVHPSRVRPNFARGAGSLGRALSLPRRWRWPRWWWRWPRGWPRRQLPMRLPLRWWRRWQWWLRWWWWWQVRVRWLRIALLAFRAIRAQHACVVLASFLRVLERACRLPPLLLTTPGVWFTERGEIVVVTAMTAVSRARRTCGHGAFVIVHGVWWRRRRQWQHCGVSSPSPNAGQVAAAAAALVAAGAAVQSEQVQEARSKNLCWRRVDQHPPRRRAAEDVERSRLVVARAPGECQHFHLQLRRRSFWSAIEAQGAGSV